MRVYIITTAKNYITEIEGARSAGDAASEIWRRISREELPLVAGIAQAGGGRAETRRIIFNPQHVVALYEMEE